MPSTVIGVSLALFAVNAAIEGAIRVSVLRAIEKLNPAFTEAARAGTRLPVAAKPVLPKLISLVALTSVTLAAIGVWVASRLPDGLEHLAQNVGLTFGAHQVFRSPLSGYEIAALGGNWFSRASAGLMGLVLIYIVCALGGHRPSAPIVFLVTALRHICVTLALHG
ncbi:MAG: hypothetical protein ACR2IV_20985 [Bryobacteraceae bacterium]